MLQRRVHVQETGGNPDYYLSFISTTLYVERSFGGHLSTINVTNDSGADTLQFSFDGASLDGEVKPGEAVKINVDQRSSVFIRGTLGGGQVRLWGWTELDQSRVVTTTGNPLQVTVEGIALSSVAATGSVTNIADNTLTTIVTVAFSAGVFENLAIVSVSGDDYAKYYLVLNTVTIDTRRSGPDRNLQFDFTGAPLALVSGDVIDIKVEHFSVGQLLDFDSTVYGYA